MHVLDMYFYTCITCVYVLHVYSGYMCNTPKSMFIYSFISMKGKTVSDICTGNPLNSGHTEQGKIPEYWLNYNYACLNNGHKNSVKGVTIIKRVLL